MPNKRRRGQSLVCAFLENIKGTALKEHQAIIRGYVRRRHGVYALYKRDRLYYVGLARNLRGRVKHHLKDRHAGRWDRFSVYLTINDGQVKELESLLLRITKPQGNLQRGKFARCEDLKKTLKRDIKRENDQKLHETLGVPGRADPTAKRRTSHGDRPLAGVRPRAFTIRARYLKTWHRARVLSNGHIRLRGRLFDSPSEAGRAVRRGHGTNGWRFWSYERSPGEWVRLSELR